MLYYPLLFGPFVAQIMGQRLAERGLHVPELLHETLSVTPCIFRFHAGQGRHTYRSLDQGADHRAIRTHLIRSPSQ
jgi:hypothetical protein